MLNTTNIPYQMYENVGVLKLIMIAQKSQDWLI